MTPAEQLDLIHKVKRGDLNARKKLAQECIGVVRGVVNSMRSVPESHRQDVEQEGHLGVQQAIDHYKLGSPMKFTNFAQYWVHARVFRYLRKCRSTVRQNYNTSSITFDVMLDEPLPGFDNEVTLLDLMPDEEEPVEETYSNIEAVQLAQAVLEKAALIIANTVTRRMRDGNRRKNMHRRVMSTLKDVVRSRIYADEPEPLDVVAARHDFSRERVRQLEQRLLKKARALHPEVT